MLQREETKFLRFVALLRFKYIRVYALCRVYANEPFL